MIKNDILIQRQDALSVRINTSSEAIYFYCASIIWVEVEHVSSSGLCFSRGSIGVTRSALISLFGGVISWHETCTLDLYFMYASGNKMRVFKMCYKSSCSTFSLNIHVCTCVVGHLGLLPSARLNCLLPLQFHYNQLEIMEKLKMAVSELQTIAKACLLCQACTRCASILLISII